MARDWVSLRKKGLKIRASRPYLYAALKELHHKGFSKEQAKRAPEVSAASHKDGFIGMIIAFVALASLIDTLWDLWDHFHDL